jgi:hypothetical protein
MATVRRSYRWVWVFVVLAVLGLTAMIVQIRYNLSQQLRPEQLAAARRLWQERGPRDYRLQFLQRGSSQPTAYVIWVRNGEPRAGVWKHSPDLADHEGQRLRPDQLSSFSMEGLFETIEDLIAADPGQRVYLVANFDPTDGHLLRFVRRVSGTQQRQEIADVKLQPAAPGEPLPSFLDGRP